MKHIVLALLAIALYPAVASAGHHNGFTFFFGFGGGGTYCAPPVCDAPACTDGAVFVSPGWRRTYEYTPHYYAAAPVYCAPRVAVIPPPVVVYRSPAVVYSPRVYYTSPYATYCAPCTSYYCYPR
jgi:hypothetical protein